jgi:hypothetical protein
MTVGRYASSAQPWDKLPEGLTRIPKNPPAG